jgi:HEAT repeat
VRWQAWGRLRGEAMYRGRPTSYWAGRLKTEQVTLYYYQEPRPGRGDLAKVVRNPFVPRQPGLPDRLCRLLGRNYTPPEELLFDGGEADRLVPVLTELLRSDDAAVVKTAARCLGGLGPEARQSAPVLATVWVRWDDSEDESLRFTLAYALLSVEPRSVAAVPGLARLLKADNTYGACWAASHLADMGPGGKVAVPSLVEALKDVRADVRKAAAEALKRIDPQAAAEAGVP